MHRKHGKNEQNLYLSFIQKIQKEQKNAKIYLVGGMVRDLALGCESKDYDLVITEVPPKTLYSILKKLGTVNLVGKTFGVYKFLPKLPAQGWSASGGNARSLELGAREIDIALPRTEHSFGTGGYRDVAVTSDYCLPIEKDLERRDFTINAMALELKSQITNPKFQISTNFQNSKLLVDPFRGIEDLKNKIIRCVGKADERFREDYSRMLRALRFSVQLGFSIEKNTWQAIKKNISKINSISYKLKAKSYTVPREIIAKELIKMFSCDPVKSLEILDKSGMLKLLMPELLKMKNCPQPKIFHSEGDVWEHTLTALNILQSKKFLKEFFPSSAKKFLISNFSSKGGSASGGQFLNKSQIPNPKNLEKKSYKLKAISYKLAPELVWALLFHDLGKPYTMTKTDRIRFNEHDMKSAELFSKIADRLKLSSAGLEVDKVKTLIKRHMLLTHGKIENMKETTIEKYFFNDQFPGCELMMHSFCDISATVPPSGKPDFTKYNLLKKRISSLKKIVKAKKNLPKDILDGNEIMKILKIPPGKKVGEIKEYLRELQLGRKIKTKKEAKKMIVKKFGK